MKEIFEEAEALMHRSGLAGSFDPEDLRRFVNSYFGGVPPADIHDRAPRDLAGTALSHLGEAARWRRGTCRVHVFNPSLRRDGWESTHTVVQVVTLDRPFLVDTVAMVINEHGFTNHLVVHPTMKIERDAARQLTGMPQRNAARAGISVESFVHVEIDRETDKACLRKLQADLERAVRDVARTVQDWPHMLDRIGDEALNMKDSSPLVDRALYDESVAFLHWVLAGNMTIFGVREYELAGSGTAPQWRVVPGTGLGVLRDERRVDVCPVLNGSVSQLSPTGGDMDPVALAKSDSRSTVHRPGYLDFVGVRRFGKDGSVTGELRVIGLYTSTAYFESPRAIPLVRQKIHRVVNKIGADRQGHDGRALMHILDTYPRAELFEATVDELAHTALGILHLQERQRVRVFIRPDRFGRYFACQVYVPRDHFDTGARRRIMDILEHDLGGDNTEFTAHLSEAPLARLHIVVHRIAGRRRRVSARAIEDRIAAAVRPWAASLQSALMSVDGEEAGLDQFKRYVESFPAAYRDDHPAEEAVEDIPFIEAAARDSRIRAHIVASGSGGKAFVFKLFSPDRIVELSRIMPILENMGVSVALEHPYEIRLDDDRRLWIHDYECTLRSELQTVRRALRDAFHDAVSAVWYGDVVNDSLNALVLTARISVRRITVLRAYARYLRQMGTPYGLDYINDAIANNPSIARPLTKLFEYRFDPNTARAAARESTLRRQLESLLDDVVSLDEDRILRTLYRLVLATVRTNYFQRLEDGSVKPYLSMKFLPERIPGLPDPKPAFEIFVYSPTVEGVHLRGGKVARGGLRWSDRREDYRTEVLGLMKAQTVKNAVIVPVGAKGGFVAKAPAADRESRRRQGVECYRMFVRGLLDLTDNHVDGRIVPPPDTVRHDDDDPYLVVAADKGTATFSDIANELAAEYRFWLGDAFASGGSDGYDHKKMGITARGAWESVRHHGEVIGLDIDHDDFRVVGIGDMSGDVFGNGMLLSRHIHLIAAFNHEHIFIDPNPNPERSFAERRRMFRRRGSSWASYDVALISAGGGVYPRSAKSIQLSHEARTALAIDADRLAPDELISAILHAPVDLLWNGGIGTYAKASAERHEDAGDKANDRLRIDAVELRSHIIGEGGNLGLTHMARIEFAASGGLINTDWIDNSGGVDCSDHEVNIKILLNREVLLRGMTVPKRNALLKSMQKDVARDVLENNRAQARAISYDEVESRDRIDWFRYTIDWLEQDAGIDRAFEKLPSDDEISARTEGAKGLFRPELASLIAWAKIALFRRLVTSDLVADPHLDALAVNYFPGALRERYSDAIRTHPLRNEIVATLLSNDVVNHMGISFTARVMGEAGVDAARVVRAWIIVNESLGIDDVLRMIDSCGPKVEFRGRCDMTLACRRAAEQATRWLVRNLPVSSIDDANGRFRRVRDEFCAEIEALLSASHTARLTQRRKLLRESGAPARLARAVSALEFLPRIFPLAELAAGKEVSFHAAASCYAELDGHVLFSSVYDAIDALPATNIWADRARVEASAVASSIHIDLTESAIHSGGADVWVAENGELIERLTGLCTEIAATAEPELAKVLVLLNQMRTGAKAY